MECLVSAMFGIFIGIIIVGMMSIKRIDELIEQGNNAEKRALTHFSKLLKIENIIKKDAKENEFAVHTIAKIKEAIANNN